MLLQHEQTSEEYWKNTPSTQNDRRRYVPKATPAQSGVPASAASPDENAAAPCTPLHHTYRLGLGHYHQQRESTLHASQYPPPSQQHYLSISTRQYQLTPQSPHQGQKRQHGTIPCPSARYTIQSTVPT